MGINDGQNAQLSAGYELVVDRVHCPYIVRTNGHLTVFPQLCLDPPFGILVAQLQTSLSVDSALLLHVDVPAVTAQLHMDASIAMANARLANLPDPSLKWGLTGAEGLVMVGRRIDLRTLQARRIDIVQSTSIPSTSFRFRAGPRVFGG